MTFACVGFSGEPGVFPYHVPDQIRRIAGAGHEIASHSWKHEWFPFLLPDQASLSLERSKLALETCIGKPGAVRGFVPPFSRPMTWYARGAISLGDRSHHLWSTGLDLGRLVRKAGIAGYGWCRVSYRTIGDRVLRRRPNWIGRPWTIAHGVVCVPHNHTGFDQDAEALLRAAVATRCPLVVVGHPSGLTRHGSENAENLGRFLTLAASCRERGELEIRTVSRYIDEQAVL